MDINTDINTLNLNLPLNIKEEKKWIIENIIYAIYSTIHTVNTGFSTLVIFEYDVSESVLSKYLKGTSTRLFITCVNGELYIISIYLSNIYVHIKESYSFNQ